MIAFVAFQVALTADSLMGPGVSLELARYRAEQVANVRYELAVDITRRDTVIGHVRLNFNRKRDGDVILDFRGHWLRDVVVNGAPAANPEFNGPICASRQPSPARAPIP